MIQLFMSGGWKFKKERFTEIVHDSPPVSLFWAEIDQTTNSTRFMRNDDVLKSISYTLDLKKPDIAEICKLRGYEPTRQEMEAIFSDEKEEITKIDGTVVEKDVSHELTAHFLDGLIIHKRGRQKGKKPPPVELPVTNNTVLKKLRIAFTLREEDVIEILNSVGFSISGSELSALFRSEDHRNFRPCGDQLLRYFLKGLADKYRNEE
nr:DUF1456 family protein [Rhodohalobacter sp. SW132]